MNLVLGTLDELKTHLLNEGLRSQTAYDTAIAQLGRGVARRFEAFCNRRFERAIDDTCQFSADRTFYTLLRYPVETVTKLEQRVSIAEGWVELDLASVIQNRRDDAGIIDFLSQLGWEHSVLRLTYTGGFWIGQSGDTNSRRTSQEDSVTVAQGLEELQVDFAQEFGSIPAVLPSLVPPEGGMIITAVATAKTTSGFKALFSFPIPAAGYKLDYLAQVTSDSGGEDEDQPAGSTARPDDLFYAWLLQAEHIWQLRDALGLSLGKDKSNTSPELAGLSRVQLVPEVKEILARYTRYAQ